jgi:translation initiation factor eIF-2B subunit delta
MSSPSKASSLPTQPPGSPKKERAAPPADKGDKKPNAKAEKAARRAAKLAARPPAPPEPAQQAAAAAPAGNAAQAAGNPAGPSRHRRAVAAAEAASSRPAAPPNPAQQYFSHLPVHKDAGTPAAFASGKIHPVVVRLGVLIASGTLRGASARTLAVLEAFREVVHDYTCPENAVVWKDLNSHISPMIAYLEGCRPKGVGVGNAIRWFKGEITSLGESETDATEAAQKAALSAAIDIYIRDRIIIAGQVISDNAREKIKPDDVIVVYARSSVVERALLDAINEMKAKDREASFSVVVVDSRPLQEGELQLTCSIES